MSTNEKYAIDVRHVSKSFSGGPFSRGITRALSDVSFQVQQGEIFGLIGPNGAGKTTLIKSILRLVFIDGGSISLNGTDQTRPSWKASVGYLPEDFTADESMTPVEVLRLIAHLRGMEAGPTQAEIVNVCEMLDINRYKHKKIGSFSTGMIRRVGLAQAILHRPSILLLDEPTNGLDPLGKDTIYSLLDDFRKRGCAILLSSHLLSEVERTANRVALMQQGELSMMDFSGTGSSSESLEEKFLKHFQEHRQ